MFSLWYAFLAYRELKLFIESRGGEGEGEGGMTDEEAAREGEREGAEGGEARGRPFTDEEWDDWEREHGIGDGGSFDSTGGPGGNRIGTMRPRTASGRPFTDAEWDDWNGAVDAQGRPIPTPGGGGARGARAGPGGKKMITIYDDEEEKRRLADLEAADKDGMARLNKELALADKLKAQVAEAHKSLHEMDMSHRDAFQKLKNDLMSLRQEVSDLDASNKAVICRIRDELMAAEFDVTEILADGSPGAEGKAAKPKLVRA